MMESFSPELEKEGGNIKNKSSFSSYLDGFNEGLLTEAMAEKNGQLRFKEYYINNLERELGSDSELEKMYTAFVQGDNIELLREKSQGQLDQLERIYIDNPSMFQLGDFVEKQNKLMSFIRAVESFSVVLSTEESDRLEFTAARERGQSNSFGYQDAIIHADKYVFASFEQIPHHMTGEVQSRHARLDMNPDTCKRSQIVFQDYANIIGRYDSDPVRAYINNMFDYETGKRILATYLAMVFDTPEEAVEFIKRNNTPWHAQRWDEILQDDDIKSRMQKIKDETGIEPPLSFEVKIEGRAARVSVEI